MTRLKKGYGCHKKNIQITKEKDGHCVAKIGLGNNMTTIISLCDIDILKEHSFYAHRRKDGKYVARSTKGQYLHRLIMDPEKTQEVDHVNADPLDNTRRNLRRCSKRQNNLAKSSRVKTDPIFHGVKKFRGLYQAIDHQGKVIGTYSTARKAAEKRDIHMLCEFLVTYGYEEEHHTFSFIEWNGSCPKGSSDSENFLFDATQDAQWDSYQVLEEHKWNLN